MEEWYSAHQEEIEQEFKRFLSFKSISTDLAYKKDILACFEWVKSYVEASGLVTEVWEGDGYPILFAQKIVDSKKPTVLIYHHYDVQPVDPIELWKSDPFKPEIRDGKMYARGAQDNKGQCFYSLVAMRAFLESNSNVNIKVIIEGEEEVGSPFLSKIVSSKKEELQADHLLIIDTDIPAEDAPGVSLGVRGVVTMEVSLQGSSVDLHSGLYGGLAYNPNRALCELLSSLWDKDGHVAVPGFYDGVSDEASSDFDFDHMPDMSPISAMASEKGYSLTEQNWIRPVLEINGMWGGYCADGFKTVIPAKAHAKLSVRTVPGQDPAKVQSAIGEFLKKKSAPGIEVIVANGDCSGGLRTSANSKTVEVVAKAYEAVFEKPCKKVLCGASIPITPLLAEASGASLVLMGMGLGSDNIHAPNEHFGMDRFYKGYLVVGEILRRLV